MFVKNTGNVTLKFGALKDTACENISPSGATELANGKEEAFTCEHTLASTGSYSNEASIENSEGAGNKTSNKVTVTVKPEPNYSIEKLQRIGAEGFGSETRAATVGQTVEYEIVDQEHRQRVADVLGLRSTNTVTPAPWRAARAAP